MKCVCPMGGDRECPDNCDRMFRNFLPAEQRVQRLAYVEKLSKQGYTQERIGTILDVSHQTVGRDLNKLNLSIMDKLKPAKTATNPKGAGRPRGKSDPPVKPSIQSVIMDFHVLREGVEFAMEELHDFVADRIGKKIVPASVDRVLRSLNAEKKLNYEFSRNASCYRFCKAGEVVPKPSKNEPVIERAELSLTAQQKLDLAIKQATRRLEIEIERRVRAEAREWIQKQLDQYNENARHYEKVLSVRRGIMSRAEYRSILSCLHPDRIQDETLKQRYAAAFHLFTQLEKAVLNEKESPTKPSDLPKTAEDLEKRKAAYQAARAAERANKRKTSANVSV